MAQHLARAGFVLHVFNRSPGKIHDLIEQFPSLITPMHGVEGISETLANPNISIIISMLFDYDSIMNAIIANAKSLKGKTFIQMSTISVEQSVHLDELTTNLGGEFVESPVLGNTSVAQAGKLQILLGCSKEQFDKLTNLNIFPSFGSIVRHVGEKPKAIKLKLCLNFLVGSLTALTASSLALVESNDLDVDMFQDIVQKSALHFKYFDDKSAVMRKREYTDMSFSVDGILKDMDCIEKMAEKSHVNTALISTVKSLFKEASESENIEGRDMSSVYEVMKKQ